METELRIRNEEASMLAGELAQLTGESVDEAVTHAIRQRLERERERTARFNRIMELAAEIRAHMWEPVSSDHSWLYDENGLPK